MTKEVITTNNSSQLGSLLRNQRKLQGLPIEQLAELCDVSSRCIGNLELNKSIPKADTFLTICRELNITHLTYFSELYPKYED